MDRKRSRNCDFGRIINFSVRSTILRGTLLLLMMVQSGYSKTHYFADFDSTNPGKKELEGGQIDIVDNPDKDAINSSAKVARCRINNGGKRAEYKSSRLATDEKKYVYRWMYYVPSGMMSAQMGWRVITQWKTWPCEVCTNYLKEICGSCGGIFNEVRIKSGNYHVWWRAEPDCREYSHNLITDRWISFKKEIYWTNTNKGYTKLWIDDKLVASHTGIKTLFDRFPSDGSCNIYWGVGLYGPLSGSTNHVDMYIDNISISDIDHVTGVQSISQSASQPLALRINKICILQGHSVHLTLQDHNSNRELRIHNLKGELVRSIEVPSSGTRKITWDRRNSTGKLVPHGTYIYSMGEHFAK